MSIINRVLQDLEARRAPATAMPGLVRPAGPARTDTRRLALLIGAGVVAIAVTAFGDWPKALGGHSQPPPAPAGMGSDTAVQTNAAPSQDAMASAAARAETLAPATAQAPAPAAEKTTSQAPVAAAALPASHATATAAAVAPARTEPFRQATTATPPAPAASTAAPEPAPVAEARIEKQMHAATQAERAQLSYRQAVESASSGHNSQAIEQALQALKIDPAATDARQLAAALLAEAGRYDDASALAREGLARSPDQPPLSYLLARLLAERGDADEALAVLNKAPSLNADGHGLRGGLLSQRGDFRLAAQDYQAAARQQPSNGLWWLGLGVALEADGRREDARQVYARAQALGLDRGELGAYLEQKLRKQD